MYIPILIVIILLGILGTNGGIINLLTNTNSIVRYLI